MTRNDSLRSDEPQDMPPSTHLWGTWELWCDLAQNNGNNATETTSRANHTSGNGNWLDHIKHVGIFDNVEAFWGLFNCILLPSQLPGNTTYFLFRSHIMPMWEHEANRRGGKWVLTFSHDSTKHAPPSAEGEEGQKEGKPKGEGMLPVDVAWQKLCLAAIGELFPCEEEEICGITVNRGKARGMGSYKEWKLCVWTRTASAEATQMAIAEFIKKMLVENIIGDSVCEPLKQIAPNTASYYCNRNEGVEKASSARMLMNFMPHRELMETKQSRAQGGARSSNFKPKYTLDL